jgi:CcmD family protein
VSGLYWLAIAFIAVWAGIGGYLVLLGARQRKLERRLDELRAQSTRERESAPSESHKVTSV